MQVEAGVLHLEHSGVEVEVSIVWDLVQGGPIYALKGDKVFMSLTAEELKALYVLYRDIELKGKIEDV